MHLLRDGKPYVCLEFRNISPNSYIASVMKTLINSAESFQMPHLCTLLPCITQSFTLTYFTTIHFGSIEKLFII